MIYHPDQIACASAFADWAHVHGYTSNADIGDAEVKRLAEAYLAGVAYALVKVLEINDKITDCK